MDRRRREAFVGGHAVGDADAGTSRTGAPAATKWSMIAKAVPSSVAVAPLRS